VVFDKTGTLTLPEPRVANAGAIAPDLPLPMDKLAWMQEQMVALGQIPKAGDLAKMVNTDIRAQAVERAGK